MSKKVGGFKFAILGLLVLLSSVHVAFAQTISVRDSTFKHWTFGSYGVNGGTGVMAVTKTVGDPPPGLINTTTTASGQTGGGYGVDNAVTTSQALEGRSFTLKIAFESGPGAYGQGQGVSLAVAQSGSVYVASIFGNTNTSTTWKQLTFKGTLTSASFELVSGSGAANPDFTSGIPTQFGLYAVNYQSGTLANYYDKFGLTIK